MIQALNNRVSVDIELLKLTYFALDEPVPYKLKTGQEILIKPIMVKDSMLFMASVDVLKIDKNSLGSVEAIQASYLKFLQKMIFPSNDIMVQKFLNILDLCLELKGIYFCNDEMECTFIQTESGMVISAKEFDDIAKIILYQNLPDYDDKYINPDIKKSMQEVDRLKNKDYESPDFERQMGIIESHTGILKEQLLKKTWRSFQILFREVCGEIEFYTTRPAAIAVGAGDKVDHYIFKKRKDKFDGYFVDMDKFSHEVTGQDADKIPVSGDEGITSQYKEMMSKIL